MAATTAATRNNEQKISRNGDRVNVWCECVVIGMLSVMIFELLRSRSWVYSRAWPRCWSRSWRWQLKGPFLDTTIHHAIKARTALVKERWRSKARIAGVNRRATRQQRVRGGRAAIVLQRTEHRIDVNLIARSI